ncbi:type II toxin-antitoxin system RelE/ParE family toxin [Spirillospora sp. NPDC049652]
MKIKWSEPGQRTMWRYVHDQEGMHAIAAAVTSLAEDPTPPNAFRWGSDGDYRLRVGPYRVMYRIEADALLIARVDRVSE